MSERKVANLLFYPMLLSFLSISMVATFYGLKATLGALALLGTAGIIIALFGSTMMIHWLRKSSSDASVGGPVAMLALALIVSTASNVNFFYTTYLERDLSRSAIENALNNFNKDVEDAKKTLRADQKLAEVIGFKAEIERTLNSLREQVLDPLNAGAGKKAQSIIADLKRNLPSLTDPALPASKNKEELLAWYNRYARLVNENAAATISDQQKEYLRLVGEMDVDYGAYTNAVEALKREGNATLIREQLGTMAHKLVEYQGRVNRLLSPNSKPWSPLHPIDAGANWIGDIARTWGSVVNGEGDPRVFLWSIMASLIIDLFPLLYSLWVVRRPVVGEFEGVVVT